MFRVIEREGVAGQHTWRVTQQTSLEVARKNAAESAVDFLIVDATGRPVEYRIA